MSSPNRGQRRWIGLAARALLVGAGLLGGSLATPACRHLTLLGSTDGCHSDLDCTPPSTVCGVDALCVPGCADDGDGCLGGMVCDPSSGECRGPAPGKLGQPCATDGDCGPPDLLCRPSTMTCAVGCTLDPDACVAGHRCDVATGHCCAPPCGDPRARPDAGAVCAADRDCAAMGPGLICRLGTCVPSCASTGCQAPLACAPDGRCEPLSGCARDADCDGYAACTQTGACAPLLDGGRVDCAGGAVVRSSCNQLGDPAAFRACVGAPGPPECPYCENGSCYRPGICAAAADCHHGDSCVGGRCRPDAPACPAIVHAADVLAGKFAAGHELCVREPLRSIVVSPNGSAFLHLGDADLTAVLTPLYSAAGVARPTVGATITVHGPVRWDEWHSHFELDPVDEIAP